MTGRLRGETEDDEEEEEINQDTNIMQSLNQLCGPCHNPPPPPPSSIPSEEDVVVELWVVQLSIYISLRTNEINRGRMRRIKEDMKQAVHSA